MMIEIWTKTGEVDRLADAAINIQGTYHSCQPLMFQKLEVVEHKDGQSRFSVALGRIVGDARDVPTSSIFIGCYGLDVGEITSVSFHNYERGEQLFCFNEVASLHLNTD
eukprot:TRINITY_DN1359_c1_g1_i8.p4 TRINITY_DN1359_c1_g1~~TRINITY_DN1359_c1_g1_i8.p4  ORF type:complete len:109 (-),score=8.00 TRINITY_DN1359_c1_g1_i8:879-1205(-)